MESGAQTLAIQRTEGHTHSFACHRVYVSPQSGAAELVRLAYRRATAHEGIENRNAGKIMGLVENLFEVPPWRQQTPQDYPAKNRAQPLRPPFVNVIDGPVDLLSPTLSLRQRREKLEREVVGLDRSGKSRCRFIAQPSRVSSQSSSAVSDVIWAGSRRTTDSRDPEASRQAKNSCSRAAPGFGTVVGVNEFARKSKV